MTPAPRAIYVFHLPIHTFALWYLARTINTGDATERVVRLAAYLVIAASLPIGAAMVSWRLLERPMLDLKDRFAPVSVQRLASD
ncbi:MAG: hypothetical protein ACHQWU_11125 [Gemmatimonadales bacterium]